MLNFTDLTGLGGIALAVAALCGLCASRLCLAQSALAQCLAVLGAVLMLLPFGGLSLAAYVRGMIGDLSITTLLMLGYTLAWRAGYLPTDARFRDGTLLLLVLAAGVFYPLALGVTPYDPYRWGYGEPWFLLLLLSLALAGRALRLPLVAPTISLAVLAWVVGWYESNNLWDYLLDPLLSIYAVCGLVWRGIARCRRRRPCDNKCDSK